jgi:hypothetical protein
MLRTCGRVPRARARAAGAKQSTSLHHYYFVRVLRVRGAFLCTTNRGKYYSTSRYVYSVLIKVPEYRYPLYHSAGIWFLRQGVSNIGG